MANPFPALAERILDNLALRPDAPMTERLLFEALDGGVGLRGLTLPDVEAAVLNLERLELVVRSHNPLAGIVTFKLTTAGKLDRGIA